MNTTLVILTASEVKQLDVATRVKRKIQLGTIWEFKKAIRQISIFVLLYAQGFSQTCHHATFNISQIFTLFFHQTANIFYSLATSLQSLRVFGSTSKRPTCVLLFWPHSSCLKWFLSVVSSKCLWIQLIIKRAEDETGLQTSQ